MSDIEDKFREAVAQGQLEIDAAMKECKDALARALAASEKYGIPFYANPSGVGQVYQPSSYSTQWSEQVDPDLLDELLEYGAGEYEGWQTSAICY